MLPYSQAMAAPDSSPDFGQLRLGCAMWAHPPWRERYGVSAANALAWYSSHFTTVEGNTTSYALPKPETVERWAEQADESLRFCFKLPRHITHERRLRNVAEQVEAFFERMAPVSDRMGPVQIQLPASFGPDDLGSLISFLDDVVGRSHGLDHPPAWAVEVRHPEFSAGGSLERPLNDALAARGVNRVILDSRALFAAPPVTKEEHEAWNAKPRLPVRPTATGAAPLIRLIGQADPEASLEIWRRWFPKLVEWLEAGVDPYVFVHTPDNVTAPELAVRVGNELSARSGGRLPPIEAITPIDRTEPTLDL